MYWYKKIITIDNDFLGIWYKVTRIQVVSKSGLLR